MKDIVGKQIMYQHNICVRLIACVIEQYCLKADVWFCECGYLGAPNRHTSHGCACKIVDFLTGNLRNAGEGDDKKGGDGLLFLNHQTVATIKLMDGGINQIPRNNSLIPSLPSVFWLRPLRLT